MRKRFICKRICALASAFMIGIGSISVPSVFAEQTSVFVDEFDGGNNAGTTKAFYSENIREILSATSSQLGDFTRATRISADKDGVLIYKSENVGAITIRGVYPQNGNFEFYYSTDNQEYIPIEPVYGNSVMKDSNTGWYGRDYFFAGFPRGTLYFKIVIPKEGGNDLYNKQINFVKIESGSTTLIDDYDDALINSFDLKSADNRVFETFEGQRSKEAMNLLYSLGIMDKRVLNPDRFLKEITRGEFASALVKLIGLSREKYSDGLAYEDFSDISSTTDYAYCIQVVSAMGYMNKMSDNSFRAENPISERDALYALMCQLGYQSVLSYSNVYSVARTASVDYGAKGGNLTVEDAAEMILACLNGKTAENRYNGEIKPSNKTYMAEFLNIDRITGQLDYSMLGSVSGSDYKDSDIVEISGVVFYAENIKFHELLGRRVYAYVKDENDKKNVVSFGTDENMDSFTVYKDEIDDSNSDLKTLYYTKNNKDKKKSIDVTKLVVNGERRYDISKDVLYSCDMINLYDGDNDGRLETAIAEKYDDYYVKSIYVTDKGITDAYTGNTFYFDSGKYDNIIFFRNGYKANFSNITENSVVSIAKSSNDKFVKVIINEKSVSGTLVSEKSNKNEIRVDKEDYKISDGLKDMIESGTVKKPKLGDEGKFYFNAVGLISAFDVVSTTERYGYMIGVCTSKESWNERIKVKIFSDDGEVKTYDTKNNLIIAFGSSTYKANGSDAINLLKNAEQLKGADGNIEGLIKYKLSEGVVTYISVPRSARLESEFSMDYENGASFTNGNDIIDLKYAVNSDTKKFYIPYDRTDERGYQNTITTTSSYGGTAYTYSIKLYDTDENRVASAMVLFADEFDADKTGLLWRRYGMVTSVNNVYDEESGDTRKAMSFITQGAERSYILADNLKLRLGKVTDAKTDFSDSVLPKDLKAGDVIKFALNNKGEIGKLSLIYDADKKIYYKDDLTSTTDFDVSTNGEITEMFVEIDKIYGNYMIVKTGSDTFLFDCSQAFASVYSANREIVYAASSGDVKPGDKAIIRSQRSTLLDIMVIKEDN